MNTKRTLLGTALFVAAGATLSAAVPVVTDVTMAQDDTRLVTISYTLKDAPAVVTVDVQTNVTGDTWASIGGENIQNVTGDVWRKIETGARTIRWRPDLSWPDHKIEDGGVRAVVTAWALDNTPDYMVVDVSDAAKPDTQTYYPSAGFVPGGVTNSLYKTTTLLMRKIMAKDVTWTMGSVAESGRSANRESTHQVTLTNNYYIGVYEVTQSQWRQVDSSSSASANFTTEQSMRPMEKVSYNEIRNAANSTAANTAYNWPAAPNPSSFLGKLRTKTGLDFDLPSEAQWEFAARAGNGEGYWNDGSPILSKNPDANMDLIGRYERNGGKVLSGTSYVNPANDCGVTNGTAIVGSYAPNSWGLYDMHGNVWEWCLDWHQDNIATAKDASGNDYGGRVNIDPSAQGKFLSGKSVASGTNRIKRGGSWSSGVGSCRSAFRATGTPSNRDAYQGVRFICTAGLR